MLIGAEKQSRHYTRTRNGKKEKVKSTITNYILQCNCCNDIFYRTSKEFKSGSDLHFCKKCYTKKVAQSRSSLARKVNNYVEKIDASSGKPLGTFTIR